MSDPTTKKASRAAAGTSRPDPRISRRAVQLQLAGLGMEFVAMILGATAVGYYLDDWLGTEPLFLMVLIFSAMAGSVARLVMLSRRLERLRRAAEEQS